MSAAVIESVAETDAPEREYVEVELSALDMRHSALRLPDPEATSALVRSIARHGVLHPLTVNRDVAGSLVVLDGFKRLRALSETPDAVVPVRIVSLTPTQAKAALLTFNRPHRGLTEVEEAWVVQALVREHELRQTEVAELLGHHKSWVCRRLQLAERLESGIVDDMRLGLISPTVARELVRLPRGNQARVAEAVQQHALTSRQTAELVGRVLDADDEESASALLDDPLRYLASASVKSPVRRDARLSTSGDKVRRSLDALERQATMTDRVLCAPTRELVSSDLDVLGPAVRAALGAVHTVLQSLIELDAPDDDGS